MTDVLLYIYVLVVLNNGQTWPKILKMSFLNRFYRDKKTITNSFLEIIVRYMLENSLKSSKKKDVAADIQNCCHPCTYSELLSNFQNCITREMQCTE